MDVYGAVGQTVPRTRCGAGTIEAETRFVEARNSASYGAVMFFLYAPRKAGAEEKRKMDYVSNIISVFTLMVSISLIETVHKTRGPSVKNTKKYMNGK